MKKRKKRKVIVSKKQEDKNEKKKFCKIVNLNSPEVIDAFLVFREVCREVCRERKRAGEYR